MNGHVGLLTESTVGWLHSGVPEPENAAVRRKMKCVYVSGGDITNCEEGIEVNFIIFSKQWRGGNSLQGINVPLKYSPGLWCR